MLLADDGGVKLTDIRHQRRRWAPRGAYVAPEVARGLPPTPAADVFSLGATLYTAVEGVPPFGDDGQSSSAPRRNAGVLTEALQAALGPDDPPDDGGHRPLAEGDHRGPRDGVHPADRARDAAAPAAAGTAVQPGAGTRRPADAAVGPAVPAADPARTARTRLLPRRKQTRRMQPVPPPQRNAAPPPAPAAGRPAPGSCRCRRRR